MRSEAKTVEDYLTELPDARREALSRVRGLILENLPGGYVEAMNRGMICYEVPLEKSGRTYNGKPLMYAALASQKNQMALYLCGLYCLPDLKKRFEAAWKGAGKKLDMGAACVRFRKLDQLELDAIGAAIAAVPAEVFVATSKAAHNKK